MGLYVSVVLVIGKFVRGFFSEISHSIMFEELPCVDRILKLCMDIFLVRETGELELEEELYSKLIFLYRSPETMIKWTREKNQDWTYFVADAASRPAGSAGALLLKVGWFNESITISPMLRSGLLCTQRLDDGGQVEPPCVILPESCFISSAKLENQPLSMWLIRTLVTAGYKTAGPSKWKSKHYKSESH